MTPKQLSVLNYVKRYWHKHGYGPTISEMQQSGACPKNRSSLHGMLQRLVHDGFLHRTAAGSPRCYMPRDLAIKNGLIDAGSA